MILDYIHVKALKLSISEARTGREFSDVCCLLLDHIARLEEMIDKNFDSLKNDIDNVKSDINTLFRER